MKWLKPEERSKIEAWLDSGDTPRGKYGPYYRLFVAICLESGLRESEIVGCTTRDGRIIQGLTHDQSNLVGEKWELVLRLKRKDRARLDAYLGKRTRRIYEELFHNPDSRSPEVEVFVGGPSVNDCYKFCRRLGNRLGIPGLHPHRFRHTVARDMVKANQPPSVIQKALGHKSGSMALRYSEALDEEAMDAMRLIRGE